MPKMLADGGVEYDDGTPATESQVRWRPAVLCCGVVWCDAAFGATPIMGWPALLVGHLGVWTCIGFWQLDDPRWRVYG